MVNYKHEYETALSDLSADEAREVRGYMRLVLDSGLSERTIRTTALGVLATQG